MLQQQLIIDRLSHRRALICGEDRQVRESIGLLQLISWLQDLRQQAWTPGKDRWFWSVIKYLTDSCRTISSTYHDTTKTDHEQGEWPPSLLLSAAAARNSWLRSLASQSTFDVVKAATADPTPAARRSAAAINYQNVRSFQVVQASSTEVMKGRHAGQQRSSYLSISICTSHEKKKGSTKYESRTGTWGNKKIERERQENEGT